MSSEWTDIGVTGMRAGGQVGRHGWTDGWADRQTDGQTYRQKKNLETNNQRKIAESLISVINHLLKNLTSKVHQFCLSNYN